MGTSHKKGVPDSRLGKLYTEHIDFIIARNVNGLLNQYAPDCLMISSFTPDKSPLYVRGHKELEAFFRERIFGLEELSTSIAFWGEDKRPDGDEVLMIVEAIEAKTTDGQSMKCRFYDNWYLKNGKIAVHYAGTVQYPDGSVA
jgi:hypothetical protein